MNNDTANPPISTAHQRQRSHRVSTKPSGMNSTTFITSCSMPLNPPFWMSEMKRSGSSCGANWPAFAAQNASGSSGIGYSVNVIKPSTYSTVRYAAPADNNFMRWWRWYNPARIGKVSTAERIGHITIAIVNDVEK